MMPNGKSVGDARFYTRGGPYNLAEVAAAANGTTVMTITTVKTMSAETLLRLLPIGGGSDMRRTPRSLPPLRAHADSGKSTSRYKKLSAALPIKRCEVVRHSEPRRQHDE
jgi:hypothetical protein